MFFQLSKLDSRFFSIFRTYFPWRIFLFEHLSSSKRSLKSPKLLVIFLFLSNISEIFSSLTFAGNIHFRRTEIQSYYFFSIFYLVVWLFYFKKQNCIISICTRFFNSYITKFCFFRIPFW